jgi:acyl carrier protein
MYDPEDEAVIDFVCERRGVSREQVTADTSLLWDLGLDGDEAIEFLEEYSERFKVDVSHFEFAKFFDSEGEGCNPFLLPYGIYLWLTRRKQREKSLKVRHLIEARRRGYLEIP